MPIYEYCCSECGYEFELMQLFSDEPAKECPTCSGGVDKLISQSTFHLKGTGWYATDYGTKSHDRKSKEKKEEKSETTDVKSEKKESKKAEKIEKE